MSEIVASGSGECVIHDWVLELVLIAVGLKADRVYNARSKLAHFVREGGVREEGGSG